MDWRDAVEFMLAGATAIQIGTANFIDPAVTIKVEAVSYTHLVWFLIQLVGDGTRRLAEANSGDTINVVVPLGNAYTCLLYTSRCV